MARVVVVGGGFAGMSVAVRLAKLRHEVTVLEASQRLGGELHGIEVDGKRWSLHSESVTLPGVFRDLFRKSGRPLEQALELQPTPGRRHLFADGEVLDLPMGRRSDQADAVRAAFGQDDWSTWVDSQTDVWEVLRRRSLDVVLDPAIGFSRDELRTLRPRRTIARLATRDLVDYRLAKLILDPIRHAGLDRRCTPGFLAVSHYVERNFGRWQFEGGWPALAAALTTRIAERRVQVEFSQRAHTVDRDPDGTVRGVRSDDGYWPSDIVIWCNSSVPIGLSECTAMPAIPASRTLLELCEDPPGLAAETWVHANPPVVLHSSGHRRWTVEHRSGEDVLATLHRFGVDLRDLVVSRHDLTPTDMVRLTHGGWTWMGWRSLFNRPGVGPSDGIYQAGAHAHPGHSLEAIGMATAAISDHIGPAPR